MRRLMPQDTADMRYDRFVRGFTVARIAHTVPKEVIQFTEELKCLT